MENDEKTTLVVKIEKGDGDDVPAWDLVGLILSELSASMMRTEPLCTESDDGPVRVDCDRERGPTLVSTILPWEGGSLDPSKCASRAVRPGAYWETA